MITGSHTGDRPARVDELHEEAWALRDLAIHAEWTDMEIRQVAYRVANGLDKKAEEEIAWQQHNQ